MTNRIIREVKNFPEGIKSITIPTGDVYAINEMLGTTTVILKDMRVLTYNNRDALIVSLGRDSVLFDTPTSKESIPFTVEYGGDADELDIKVSVSDERYVKASVSFDGKNGELKNSDTQERNGLHSWNYFKINLYICKKIRS